MKMSGSNLPLALHKRFTKYRERNIKQIYSYPVYGPCNYLKDLC